MYTLAQAEHAWRDVEAEQTVQAEDVGGKTARVSPFMVTLDTLSNFAYCSLTRVDEARRHAGKVARRVRRTVSGP
jgi:hypothetical protein